jgi:Ca2+/Na+ antiporter
VDSHDFRRVKELAMAKDRWSLRNIYLYLVCLITLIMVIVAAVGLVRSTVELVYPDPGYYYAEPVKQGADGMTQEEIDRQNEMQEQQSRRQAILNLVGNGAMLLVAGPLYLYHWKKIEVEHVEQPAIEPTTSS